MGAVSAWAHLSQLLVCQLWAVGHILVFVIKSKYLSKPFIRNLGQIGQINAY